MKIMVTFRLSRRAPWVVSWKDVWVNEPHKKVFRTEEDARKFAAELEERMEREKEIKVQSVYKVNPNRDKYTVGQILDLYISHNIQPKYRENTYQATTEIRAIFGKRKAHCLTRKDADTLREVLLVRGLRDTTVYRRMSVLRAALNWAERKGYISRSKWNNLHISKGVAREFPVPSIEQLESLMKCAPERIVRIIVLGLYTGCRIGPCELFRLTWDQVDIPNRTIYIPSAQKGVRRYDRTHRAIPMRDDLVPALWTWRRRDRERYPENQHVIHYRGKPVIKISYAWNRALERAGITLKFRPYDLRHAFATHAISSGQDAMSVAQVMGHSSTAMLMHTYLHHTRKLAESAVCSIPGNLGRLVPLDD